MQYFTPELFVRFNSVDDDIADRASDEWENALATYRAHLRQIWAKIPKDAKKLAELNLHDAELLNPRRIVDSKTEIRFEKIGPPSISLTPGILPVKHEDRIVTLIYLLAGTVHQHASARNWPFSKERPHWLYDEVDIMPEQSDQVVHRVLISDGRMIEIPFVSLNIHSTPLSPLATAKLTRMNA
jgi:hypothetical protein